jgi:hypothetical protein
MNTTLTFCHVRLKKNNNYIVKTWSNEDNSAWELVGNFAILLPALNMFPMIACVFNTYLEDAILS